MRKIDAPTYFEMTHDEILDEAEQWLNLTPEELNSTPIWQLEVMLNEAYEEAASEAHTRSFYSY